MVTFPGAYWVPGQALAGVILLNSLDGVMATVSYPWISHPSRSATVCTDELEHVAKSKEPCSMSCVSDTSAKE